MNGIRLCIAWVAICASGTCFSVCYGQTQEEPVSTGASWLGSAGTAQNYAAAPIVRGSSRAPGRIAGTTQMITPSNVSNASGNAWRGGNRGAWTAGSGRFEGAVQPGGIWRAEQGYSDSVNGAILPPETQSVDMADRFTTVTPPSIDHPAPPAGESMGHLFERPTFGQWKFNHAFAGSRFESPGSERGGKGNLLAVHHHESGFSDNAPTKNRGKLSQADMRRDALKRGETKGYPRVHKPSMETDSFSQLDRMGSTHPTMNGSTDHSGLRRVPSASNCLGASASSDETGACSR